MVSDPKDQNQTECRQCGTCCRKGGPAFHKEDRLLITEGKIPGKYLYTIREGEIAYDNITGRLVPLKTDIIKIKSSEKVPTCMFFDTRKNACKIYEHRPAECRLLKCWDTEEIETYYTQSRLTRKELIGDIHGLWEIVADHHQQCDVGPIKTFADRFCASMPIPPDLEKKVEYIIRYDLSVRSLVGEKGNMDLDMLPFLFGRPMLKIMESMGVRTVQHKGKLVFNRC